MSKAHVVPNETHQFALFMPGLEQYALHADMPFVIRDASYVHRITRVLRLKVSGKVILFDRVRHMQVVVIEMAKKAITCRVVDCILNTSLSPHITVWLPLLRRDALETAIYNLVEVGANEIQLVKTEKMQSSWHGISQMDRLEKIMIAAAEQSKNFSIPELHKPQELSELLDQKVGARKFFFDVGGLPLLHVANKFHAKLNERYIILVGPEGDLSKIEKERLAQHAWQSIVLTPTVLRAQQAATLGVAALRSLL